MNQMLAASDADESCVPWGARIGSVVRVASAREWGAHAWLKLSAATPSGTSA
jgi:hypothetical protein